MRPAGASQIIVNGGFENGTAPWLAYSRSGHQLITAANPHTGSAGAQLCGGNSCYDYLAQTVTLPTTFTRAVLSYWIYVTSQETAACADLMSVRFTGVNVFGIVLGPAVCDQSSRGAWTHQTADLSSKLQPFRGKQVRLSFTATTNAALPTTFFVDDVALDADTSLAPTSTPTPTATLTGGGGGGSTGVLISSDPFAGPTPGQHRSEVEPDTFAFGDTLLAGFQVGRFYDGGSTDIGWARLRNGSWQSGLLPGLTTSGPTPGPYARASDPSVAYDAAHSTWLITSLDLNSSTAGVAVSVNRSADGVTWAGALTVSSAGLSRDYDKDWIVCDNTSTSPYYGHCYVAWDDDSNGDTILMSTSADGGQTWSAAQAPAGTPLGLGGQPLVQPNGKVIVPASNSSESGILAFSSSNGGLSWGNLVSIAVVAAHNAYANLRTEPLPTAELDGAGNVFVAWQDCRFETGCSANDIVYSQSPDGVTWSSVKRIPIDPVGSGVDHFIPGLAVSAAASGASGRLALTYYYYPIASCGACQMDVGYVTSINGGLSWSVPVRLAGPMQVAWLPSTNQGVMVGDYMSTSFLGTQAVSVFPVASLPSGGVLNQPVFGASESVTGGSRTTSVAERAGAIGATAQKPSTPATSR